MIRRIMQVEIHTNQDPGYEELADHECEILIREPRTGQKLQTVYGDFADWYPDD